MLSGMKTCKKCLLSKSLEDFHVSKRSPDGKQARCKECMLASSKEWRENQPAARDRRSKRDLLERQKRCCAACGDYLYHGYRGPEESGGLPGVLDHERAVLCSSCSIVLGHTRRSTQRLKALVSYLEASADSVFSTEEKEE